MRKFSIYFRFVSLFRLILSPSDSLLLFFYFCCFVCFTPGILNNSKSFSLSESCMSSIYWLNIFFSSLLHAHQVGAFWNFFKSSDIMQFSLKLLQSIFRLWRVCWVWLIIEVDKYFPNFPRFGLSTFVNYSIPKLQRILHYCRHKV